MCVRHYIFLFPSTDPMLHHYSMNSLEDGNGTKRNHQFIHTSIHCHSTTVYFFELASVLL